MELPEFEKTTMSKVMMKAACSISVLLLSWSYLYVCMSSTPATMPDIPTSLLAFVGMLLGAEIGPDIVGKMKNK